MNKTGKKQKRILMVEDLYHLYTQGNLRIGDLLETVNSQDGVYGGVVTYNEDTALSEFWKDYQKVTNGSVWEIQEVGPDYVILKTPTDDFDTPYIQIHLHISNKLMFKVKQND